MKFLRNNPIVRLLSFINNYFHTHIGTIFLLALLSFISSITEGIGINAIIPLFSFVNGAGGQAGDAISKMVQHVFETIHIPYTFRFVFIMVAVLFIVKAIVLFASQYISLRTQMAYEQKKRAEVLRVTLESDWMYLSKQKLGHLEQMLVMGVEQGSKFLIRVSNILIIIANLAVYSFLALNISLNITALALGFGVLMFFAIKPVFRMNKVISEATMGTYKDIAHFINETIIGLKVVKASHVEEQIEKKASISFTKLRELRFRVGLLGAVSASLIQPLPLFFILGIFAFFYSTGGFNFASFAVIVYAINRVFNNFQNLQTEIINIISFMPFITSVENYVRESKSLREFRDGTEPFHFSDRLEFKNVSFAYPDGSDVVSDISIMLRKGELLGLIGPSGAGKTTLVDLFLRLLVPNKGTILLDGVPAMDIQLKAWREQVGYVSQDIFLFNDTIANNIRFYSSTVSDADIEEAAKLANIYEFIQEQPAKFDALVGERGIKLSGGQRQRIALARVLARKPQILILDEATSALDTESEILVQKAIEGLHGKMTVLAIAHRLSTIIDSDRLIVMESGKIVEEGPPRDLLKNENSYFSKVYNLRK